MKKVAFLCPWLCIHSFTTSANVNKKSSWMNLCNMLSIKQQDNNLSCQFDRTLFLTHRQSRPRPQWGNSEAIRKHGDLADAREITTVWTYFRDNHVEQLLNFKKKIGKGVYVLSKYQGFFHVYFNKKVKTQHNKYLYFNKIRICHFYKLM